MSAEEKPASLPAPGGWREIESAPVGWRYCYDRGPGTKRHWTLTQRPVESQPATPGHCAVIAEPLYLALPEPPYSGGGKE